MSEAVADQAVLGFAVGYRPQQIRPFVESLRRSGFGGSVVLWVDRRDADAFRLDSSFSEVEVLPHASWPPRRLGLEPGSLGERWLWRPAQAVLWTVIRAAERIPLPRQLRLALRAAVGQFLYPPTESRFLSFASFLCRRPFRRVLISDTRDVVFQRDPFSALPARGLCVALESADYTVGTEDWNRRKTLLIYGERILRSVADKRVSCSGVSGGDHDAMMRYLELMGQEIVGMSRRVARVGWFDQVLHNVVVWLRWQGAIDYCEPHSPVIGTLGGIASRDIRQASGGAVLAADGSTVAIVHQYDRHPELASGLLSAVPASGGTL